MIEYKDPLSPLLDFYVDDILNDENEKEFQMIKTYDRKQLKMKKHKRVKRKKLLRNLLKQSNKI